jgi:hypothetical protein
MVGALDMTSTKICSLVLYRRRGHTHIALADGAGVQVEDGHAPGAPAKRHAFLRERPHPAHDFRAEEAIHDSAAAYARRRAPCRMARQRNQTCVL